MIWTDFVSFSQVMLVEGEVVTRRGSTLELLGAYNAHRRLPITSNSKFTLDIWYIKTNGNQITRNLWKKSNTPDQFDFVELFVVIKHDEHDGCVVLVVAPTEWHDATYKNNKTKWFFFD